MFSIKHTFGFKHVRYQFIVDFHEFFVYFLIIFGVFIPEKYENPHRILDPFVLRV